MTVVAESVVVRDGGLRRTLAVAEPLLPVPSGWPLLATAVSAECGAAIDESVLERLSLDAHLVRQPESTVLMRVQGDTLAALGIHDGDLLVVDRALPPTTGSLVVAVIGERLALRRIGRDDQERLALEPLPTFDEAALIPQRINLDDASVALWGVARWVIHRLWPGRPICISS